MKTAILLRLAAASLLHAGNPIITDVLSADPAPLVMDGTMKRVVQTTEGLDGVR